MIKADETIPQFQEDPNADAAAAAPGTETDDSVSTDDLVVYKCPNCGAPVHKGAICAFCGQPYVVVKG